MIEQFGVNILIPLGVFLWIIAGANIISGAALEDVIRRRKES